MNKHKWHKEIKAWADGAEIEHRYIGHSDYFKEYKEWNADEQHNFFIDGNWEYRIKQQPKEPQYVELYIDRRGWLGIKNTDPFGNDLQCIGKIKLEQDDE